ncbi:MAG: CDP-diacylglycerol--glycerol-3-phosphate 3-phosphatidyltransferase [Nitrospinota bacterium]
MSRINLPNKLTLFRIFLVPLILVFLISPSVGSSIMAAIVFLVAAITDWLDGHLARVTNQVTLLGKLLDPIADKILILAALAPLVELGRISAWILVVIIGRDITISGLRMIASSQGITIAASATGKYKMICEVVGIIFLILNFHISFYIVGITAIYIAMFLAIFSAVSYFLQFWSKINLFEN